MRTKCSQKQWYLVPVKDKVFVLNIQVLFENGNTTNYGKYTKHNTPRLDSSVVNIGQLLVVYFLLVYP